MSTLVPPEPGNRFRFRFVFVSCAQASGRGEAAWAREGAPPQRWALGFEILRLLPATFRVKVAAIRVSFKLFGPNSFGLVLAS